MPPVTTDNSAQIAYSIAKALSRAGLGVSHVRERTRDDVLRELEEDASGFLASHHEVTDRDGQTYRVVVVRT